MIRRSLTDITAVIVASGILTGGCRTLDRASFTPAAPTDRSVSESRVVLAAYLFRVQGQQGPNTKQGAQETAPKEPPTETPPLGDQSSVTEEEQKTETPPTLGYTAPSASIRRDALLAIALAATDISFEQVTGGGKEAAESVIGVSQATTGGRPGLIALRQGVAGAASGRPGLQGGTTFELGLASQFNVLMPQDNLLSGPMGRCNDLARAGFFGGSHATCVRHFRPQ